MLFKANCKTTATGIIPHRDINRALQLTLSLDIPFWPQFRHVSYYEDMYTQFPIFPKSIDKSAKVN